MPPRRTDVTWPDTTGLSEETRLTSFLEREPDERLVERAQAAQDQDTRPFEALVGRYQGMVVRNCRLLTRSPNDAEDLAQEVFVKAYFALRRFERRARFRTWLQRIKLNHCLNFLRSARRATLVDVEAPGLEGETGLHVEASAEREFDAASARARIMAVLDDMSDTLRVPLVLRDADGLAYEEIAEELGIGLSATKMRIKRAREEFRRRFNDSEERLDEGTAPAADTPQVEPELT